ncbi:hypothetical protein Pmani_002061 [Petrolisthes manimaculis]|uniref:Uncharacterized protein n=1 Tax=Petrolisthes manimaculis TaxID=1843537 RepID=A0AAE1UQT4_9EUCA|nr:hypothetical protein Pmani_002061 [Petrolisthes manimaculis]
MPVTYQRRGGGDAEGGRVEGDEEVIVGEKGGGKLLKSTMGTANKYELEDYVYEMECRAEEEQEVEDVNARLVQKERDLILAAELGKALLERNEILVQQNERLAEEYSHKLEVCRLYMYESGPTTLYPNIMYRVYSMSC